MEHKPFAVIAPVAVGATAILILGILFGISSTAAAAEGVCGTTNQTDTYLRLDPNRANPDHLSGALVCGGGGTVYGAVPGAVITFSGTAVHPEFPLVTTTEGGQSAGDYSVKFAPPTELGKYTVQAHFAGLKPSDKWPAGLKPSDSNHIYIIVK